MANHRPPVIPEIAKAYQNDPRTVLAQKAIAAASSTAPVAQGGYAYADGIARVLQGLGGAYLNKRTQEKYADEEQQLLDQRKARGVDAITGAAAPPQPPAPAVGAPVIPAAAPPQAAAIAAALGSPPAPQQPPAPAMGLPPAIPAAPVPTPIAPTTGGSPQRRSPFGSATDPLAPPVAEPVPDAPAAVARPNAPAAVGPTRSKLLDAAYRIMADANPYESASGQDMYASGLSDQDKLNEAAAERAQHIQDMGYQSDLGQYGDSQSQARGAAYAERTAAQNRNFQADERYRGQAFQHNEGGIERAFKARESALDRSNNIAVANTRSASGTDLTDEERAAISDAVGRGDLDLKGVTKFQAKVVARSLIDNPGLDAIHLHAVATLAANPAAQQKAMLATTIPSILRSVRDSGKKLNFSDAQFVGKAQSWAKGQFNDPDFVEHMAQRVDAMQTLAQFMGGSGATDIRTKMEDQAAGHAMSPRAWDAWYRGQLQLATPRIQMYEDRRLVPKGTTAAITGNITPGAAVAQRKPGETIPQYLARTGG